MVERREGKIVSIGEVIERNIELATSDPVVRGGFTQIPNFILRDSTLSLGARLAYSLFLHFAWNKESCFPGQKLLAEYMGTSVSRASFFIKELESAGLIEISRRGLGKVNLYRVHFAVKNKGVRTSSKVQIPAGRNLDSRRQESRFPPAEVLIPADGNTL